MVRGGAFPSPSCDHGPMTKPIIAVVVGVVIWVLLLPALVVRDATGGFSPPWRHFLLVALAVGIVAVGCWLVAAAVRRLSEAGVNPFGIHPGPELVTDGLYARVRNSMDLGNTLLALAPMVAVDLGGMWIVPLAAFLYYLVGVAPLENRYLKTRFGAQWDDYRANVPVWPPLWR